MRHAAALLLAAIIAALPPSAAADELPPVKTAEPRDPIVLPADTRTPSVYYRRFLVRLPSDRIGVTQSGGVFGCSGTTELRASTELNTSINREVGRALRRELDAARYTRAAASDSAFGSPQTTPPAADYDIGATLKDLQIAVCQRDKQVTEGAAWVQMRWELFSPRLQKVVFEATTEGSARVAAGEKLPLPELLQRAITGAVRSLLADARFSEQVRTPPPEGAGGASGPAPLKIARRASPDAAGDVQDRIPQMQSAVATLMAGTGSGSGFYISTEGYLLTNQHVVGDAKYLKVKLSTGRELVGEVLRSDRKRDVALVKTEAVALAPFEIGAAEARAGEDVYVLGSPLGASLAATVTRGVLSATREMDQQRWLQSDVRILPGSSGGPMVGRSGAVVGITAMALGQGMAGINFFVPIADALAALKIDFQ